MGSLRLVTTTSASNPNEHDLFVDDSGQLEWIGGDITDQSSYAAMISQRIKCRLLLVAGEWYLDQRLGTPWKEIWKKGATTERVKAVIRDVIIGTPGVRSLDSLSVEYDNPTRTATIEFSATSEMNQVVTNADLDAPFIIEVPQNG